MTNVRKVNIQEHDKEQISPDDPSPAGESQKPGTADPQEPEEKQTIQEFSPPRTTGLVTEVSRAGFSHMSGAKWVEYESGTSVLIPVRNEYLMVFDSLSSLEAFVNKFGTISTDVAPDPSTILMVSKIRVPA